MKRAVNLSLIMVWVLATLGGAQALADENSAANRLIVETVGLLNQARAEANPERRFELIAKVETNLHRIIERYPGSNAAVALATGQGIGILSLERVANEKARYEALTIAGQARINKTRCFAAPSRECLWALALAMGRNIDDAERRAVSLGSIAISLAEAGNVGRTREIIEEALIAAKGIGGAYQRAIVFGWMSYLQAEIGDFWQARKSIATALLNVKKVESSGNRAAIFEQLAKSQAKAGDAKLARETVGKALAAAKDFERESAEEFPGTDVATWALSRVVGTQAKVGAVDEALATARAFPVYSGVYPWAVK